MGERQASNAAELKEMCAAKGLKLGVGKDDRIATLVEAMSSSGEVDKAIAGAMRSERREELSGMDKAALKTLCNEAGVDVMVKEVAIERILCFESEHGRIDKPQAKKARTSKQ